MGPRGTLAAAELLDRSHRLVADTPPSAQGHRSAIAGPCCFVSISLHGCEEACAAMRVQQQVISRRREELMLAHSDEHHGAGMKVLRVRKRERERDACAIQSPSLF